MLPAQAPGPSLHWLSTSQVRATGSEATGLGLLLTSVGTRSQAPFSHDCPDVPPPVVLWIPPDGRQSSH